MLAHINSKSLKTKLDGSRHKVDFFRVLSKNKKIEVIHNILLLDLSRSMRRNIHQMKNEVKEILGRLKGFVSIICYSGHGESYVLFKCVECNETSYKMNKVHEKIENIDTIGLTVMSEPLQKSFEIQKELSNIVDLTNVILFTDGCIVADDNEKEENECLNIVDRLYGTDCIISTIGFGPYYDKDFLNHISSKGYHCHIDDIKEYNCVVNKIIENSKTRNNGIIISQESIRLFNVTTGESGSTIMAYPNNVIAVIDGELDCKYESKPESDIAIETDSFYYSLAKHYLKLGDIDEYESTVKTLIGDVHLYKQTKNSYSFIEQGKSLGIIDECINNESKRFQSGRKFIIDNEDKELSVLEVITTIIEDEGSKLYWNKNCDYKRTGMKTNKVDDDLAFSVNPYKMLFDVIDCSISSEKLNISVTVKYDGYAHSEKKSFQMKANMVKTYNVICNGNLNVRYLNASLSESVRNELESNKVKFTVDANDICTIDLKGLKTANKRTANKLKGEDLIKTLIRLKDYKIKQKVLNKAIKTLLDGDSKVDHSNLSETEIYIRKELCIDEKGNFRPKTEKSTEQFEVYPATFMTWDVKIDSKKLEKEYQEQLKTEIFDKFDRKMQIELLNKFLEYFRMEIRKDMFAVNCSRIANAMIKKPVFIFDSVSEKSKIVNDKIMNQNMVVNSKVDIYTKVFDNTIFTQKKWQQLLKCS